MVGKDYTLAGEEFFREMMRPEEERRQRLAAISDDLSNVVSFQDYKRRVERAATTYAPRKPWRG
jgi:propanediol dehydratase small subunit